MQRQRRQEAAETGGRQRQADAGSSTCLNADSWELFMHRFLKGVEAIMHHAFANNGFLVCSLDPSRARASHFEIRRLHHLLLPPNGHHAVRVEVRVNFPDSTGTEHPMMSPMMRGGYFQTDTSGDILSAKYLGKCFACFRGVLQYNMISTFLTIPGDSRDSVPPTLLSIYCFASGVSGGLALCIVMYLTWSAGSSLPCCRV